MDPKPETHVWWVGTEVHSEDLRTNLNLTVLASPPAAQTMSRWKNSNLISSVCQQMCFWVQLTENVRWTLKGGDHFLPLLQSVRSARCTQGTNRQTGMQSGIFNNLVDLEDSWIFKSFVNWFIVSLWKYEKYQNTLKFCWRTSPSVNWRWKQSWVFCRSAAH